MNFPEIYYNIIMNIEKISRENAGRRNASSEIISTHLKYGFCKKLLRHKCTSDQLNTVYLTSSSNFVQVTSYKIHTLTTYTQFRRSNQLGIDTWQTSSNCFRC